MFEEALGETERLITAGKLRQYSIESKEGINHLIHYTTGRVAHEGVTALDGVREFPVIHNTTRPAKMILREAYMGPDNLSHRRYPSDVIGISRE